MKQEKLILSIVLLILIGAIVSQEIKKPEDFTYLKFSKNQGILQYTEKILSPEMLKKMKKPVIFNDPINPALYYKYSEKTKNITNLNLGILDSEELNETLRPFYGAKIEMNHRFAKIFPANNNSLPANHLKRNLLVQIGIFEKRKGIFVSSEYGNISFLFMPIGLANLREYTLSDKGYESNSYRQYCKSIDKINNTNFYENLIQTSLIGINENSFENINYEESITLMDAVGITMTEHHRILIEYGKEKNKTANAGGVITKSLFSLYFNNGGKVLGLTNQTYNLQSSDCMWQETFIFINSERKLNEKLITKYILLNHPQLNKKFMFELGGNGSNIFEDIRTYILNPSDYNNEKQGAINELIKIMKTETAQINEFLKTEI